MLKQGSSGSQPSIQSPRIFVSQYSHLCVVSYTKQNWSVLPIGYYVWLVRGGHKRHRDFALFPLGPHFLVEVGCHVERTTTPSREIHVAKNIGLWPTTSTNLPHVMSPLEQDPSAIAKPSDDCHLTFGKFQATTTVAQLSNSCPTETMR